MPDYWEIMNARGDVYATTTNVLRAIIALATGSVIRLKKG